MGRKVEEKEFSFWTCYIRHAYWQQVKMSSGQRDRQAGIPVCGLAQKFTFGYLKSQKTPEKKYKEKKRYLD